MNIKTLIKSYPLLYSFLLNTYTFFKTFPVRIKRGLKKHPNMLEGEINVFRAIFKYCEIIVDVGARYDVDYVKLSKGNYISYYFFEANPKFYRKLIHKLNMFDEKITCENLAVGESEKLTNYYEDSESILKSTTAVKNSEKKIQSQIKMIRLDDYFTKLNIKKIDFIKTDIEEYDFFALLGLGEILFKCKFVQFELGIGAPFNGRFVNNQDYYDLFKNKFKLFIVKDENNPLWKSKIIYSDLISLEDLAKKSFNHLQKLGYGFNIFCVSENFNNKLELNVTRLKETHYDRILKLNK
jgi:FkbM family methyltransferase